MDASLSPIQVEPLQRATDSEFALYRAALEWDLIEPIIIEGRDDLRSEAKWRELVEPYYHQVTNLITFCRRLPVTLLADDVGLGKTISAGLIVSELMSRGRVSKLLVVCPKLLIPQWAEELKTKFGIDSVGVVGSKLRDPKLPSDVGAVITTYHSARSHFDAIAEAGYQMLILDEAHKLRNLFGVEKTPQVAQQFHRALADRVFKYVLMLTATPIQNRLWDLYSLVELLTAARGHQNPFGTEGLFARNYIADNRSEARHLKPEKQEEFRNIVYGYMSRIRRGDANLHFPDRVIQRHQVDPTPEELELINIIAEPIQKLNRLVQISILQALISSPHALASQLNNMARKGTVDLSLAQEVQAVVNRIKTTAKLHGLATLVSKLRTEQSDDWRMVIFTSRRETQTSIQIFLEEQGITCGLINGESGSRNQETIQKFKKKSPDIHVIVSTEAGSEGVNLQAANVLVNYDLPWNPMIVEQRIGRIQRLASEHAKVCIFNVVLRGTFEEYIVGRLMEKLQMASQAIGDIESLLEAADMNDEDETGVSGFEEKIRKLVVASLAGKNVEAATLAAEKSIVEAKTELEREKSNIDTMLGGMDGAGDSGPRSPQLPKQEQSMNLETFTIAALKSLGARISEEREGKFIYELAGRREVIRFESSTTTDTAATLFAHGTPSFERLVHRISATGRQRLIDADHDIMTQMISIAQTWASQFGGVLQSAELHDIWRCFDGQALMRVRATVAHDSYERLVNAPCASADHRIKANSLESVADHIEDPRDVGISIHRLLEATKTDPGIEEFCRFYNERKVIEAQAAAGDVRKKKKLEDDFTPRLESTLVGLDGTIHRELKVSANYKIDDAEYSDFIVLIPSRGEVVNAPAMATCEKTHRSAPTDCLAKCAITGISVLRHLLVRSEISNRSALPEHIITCALTGKRVLADEVTNSDVTGNPVISNQLKKSAISGKKAEPQYFGRCDFTGVEALENELSTSEVSGKRYRLDEELVSAVSGKHGHKKEFIKCTQTAQPLLLDEAERCEVTGKSVMPGLLERCAVTGKHVLHSELDTCLVSRKKALKTLLVSSSISGAHALEEESIRSVGGKFCLPSEAKTCIWSGALLHPDDLRTCELTGIRFNYIYATTDGKTVFEPLLPLLNGIERTAERSDLWLDVSLGVSKAINGGKSKVESSILSPDGNHVAACVEVRTWLGLKVRHAGLIYAVQRHAIEGHVATGKREAKKWIEVMDV